MADEFSDISEDDGLTLGPEDALEREIARSKALKVERLQLRDRIEKLTGEVQRLEKENQRLQQAASTSPPSNTDNYLGAENSMGYNNSLNVRPGLSTRWVVFLLIFNLAALALLLILWMQR